MYIGHTFKRLTIQYVTKNVKLNIGELKVKKSVSADVKECYGVL